MSISTVTALWNYTWIVVTCGLCIVPLFLTESLHEGQWWFSCSMSHNMLEQSIDIHYVDIGLWVGYLVEESNIACIKKANFKDFVPAFFCKDFIDTNALAQIGRGIPHNIASLRGHSTTTYQVTWCLATRRHSQWSIWRGNEWWRFGWTDSLDFNSCVCIMSYLMHVAFIYVSVSITTASYVYIY